MHAKELLDIAGSPVRLELIRYLMVRPRSLLELSEHLGLTPQGVMKHLAILSRKGILQAERVPKVLGAGTKKLFRLRVPFSIDLEEDGGMIGLHVFVSKGGEGRDEAIEGQSLLKRVQEVEDEKHSVLRRLRHAREGEARLAKELFSLEFMQRSILEEAGCDIFEEAATRASLRPDYEEEIERLSRALKVDIRKIGEGLKRFSRSDDKGASPAFPP